MQRNTLLMRLLILPLLLLSITFVTAAQSANGQFGVRAFEDRNANGVLDVGEPLLTRGVAVSLENADGVIVATGVLDDSPNAAQGLIVFQFLEAGDYTLVASAPELSPTTETRFTRLISGGSLATIVDFGLQREGVTVGQTNAATATQGRGLFGLPIYLGAPGQVARVGLSLLGALVAAFVTLLLGVLVYNLTVRRAYRRALAAMREAGYGTGRDRRTTTGSLPAVRG